MARYLVLKMFRSGFPVGGMAKGFTAQAGESVELKTETPEGKPDPMVARLVEDGYIAPVSDPKATKPSLAPAPELKTAKSVPIAKGAKS